MSLMPELTTLVNRTSKVLTARFDGVDYKLLPGDNLVPKVLVPNAKNQNIRMGSEDEIDPSDFVSLVGVKGKDDCSPLEQDEDEPTRVQLSKIVGDNVKIVRRGKKIPRASDSAVSGGPGSLSPIA